MPSRRNERLNEQLRREIAELLRLRVRDPRVQGVSVTGVEVTPDLWVARVYVTLPGDEPGRADAMAGLEAATPFMRGRLGKELHIRRVPELRFVEDRTLTAASRIEELLRRELGAPDADAGEDEAGERDSG